MPAAYSWFWPIGADEIIISSRTKSSSISGAPLLIGSILNFNILLLNWIQFRAYILKIPQLSQTRKRYGQV